MSTLSLGRNQRINQIGLALVVVVVAVFYFTRSRPSVSSVDGTYSNPCCALIRLNNGVLIAGDARVPFKLRDMKFGLTAYSTQAVQIGPGNVILTPPVQEPWAIAFDDDHKGFKLKGHATEYDFRRQ